MAHESLTPPLSETTPDDPDRKKTKRKSRARFAAPLPLETSQSKAVEKPGSILDAALANLEAQKQKTAEKSSKEKDEAPEVDEAETERADVSAKPENPAAENSYEHLAPQELQRSQFSGGEVVIDLNGPVEEHVVPLHDTESSAEPSRTDAPEQPVIAPHFEQRPTEEVPALVQSPEIPSAEVMAPPVAAPPEQLIAAVTEPVETLQPHPEDIYQPPVATPNVVASAAERPATKQDVEDAMYYATKAGQNKGLLTGLLVGGGYEHLKHRRREKRQERRFKKQSKQFEQTRKDQHFYYEQTTKDQMNNERRFASTEKQLENLPQPEKRAMSVQPDAPEQQLAIPTDHRLETSVWHSIEVDNKTGKAVENPAFTYGHEYYRERAQEATPKEQRNSAAGEVALVAAAMSQNGVSATGSVPPDATAKQAPPNPVVKVKDTLLAKTAKPSSASGPLWPWIVALVVVVCLIAVIH